VGKYLGLTISREDREISLCEPSRGFCANYSKNSRYNCFTFLPLALFHYFKLFFNIYFLTMTLSQFIPAFDCGYKLTFLAPLLCVSLFYLCKEAWDDSKRRAGDKLTNNLEYEIISEQTTEKAMWKDLKVGTILKLKQNDVVPADVILLARQTNEDEVYIRTDQLDGETDSKQRIPVFEDLDEMNEALEHAQIWADKPERHIHSFNGRIDLGKSHKRELNLQNTMWMNTVLAS